MQVVAVQLNMAWEDKPANHRRVRELLASEEIQPGSLIVLPELYETGFSMNVAATAQDESLAGEALLRELAAEYASTVLGGVAAPVENGQSKNEAVAFGPDGSELVRYQKMQPFSLSGEDQHYPAGTKHQLFNWHDVCVAPFICYDLRFPERFRPAIQAGAEMIVVIACWPAKRSEHWVRLLQARAIENLAVVVGVNRCGGEPGLVFDGRSCAFDHMGVPLFEADDREQVIKLDVDIEAARRWREKFPALRDMSPTPALQDI
jgi:predicted amidohydrolase